METGQWGSAPEQIWYHNVIYLFKVFIRLLDSIYVLVTVKQNGIKESISFCNVTPCGVVETYRRDVSGVRTASIKLSNSYYSSNVS
jgi:hypothetical protein